ncbi:MAG: polyprenyl synthetase family protein [Weeksellaceae bacterium]|jgi:geranylgeranyl diphosphate synthase type II|nr:polyprenyl synthetase family protein [Weeksellaceae bacterium]
MNTQVSDCRTVVREAMEVYAFNEFEPKELYDACHYILSLGGKRIRPVLCLMGNLLFDGDLNDAIKPALGIEFFHNFTLMHDDIMDQAPLRRGKQTVHLKYDLGTGILSGDALIVQAYRMFEDLPADKFKHIVQLFSKTAEELCEGQQYDKNFETLFEVSYEDYIRMIEYKTAVLVAAALQIGAITAEADLKNQSYLYEFGRNLGIAFQLQDDYLDVFGEGAFGKLHAGDIIENKKTILYVKAIELSDKENQKALKDWYSSYTEDPQKIEAVKLIFQSVGADMAARELIEEFTQKAMNFLDKVEVDETNKLPLRELANELMKRKI